jgi:hypothetical protein
VRSRDPHAIKSTRPPIASTSATGRPLWPCRE